MSMSRVGPDRWLAAVSPHGGLDYLCDDGPGLALHRTKAGRRKLRLFACACARRVWELVPAGLCRAAIGLAERLADRGLDSGPVAVLSDYDDRTGPLSGRHAADAAMACVNSNIRYAIAVAAQAAARAVAWARL